MKSNNNSVTRDNLVLVLIIQIYKCSSIMARQFMCLALVVIQEEDMANEKTGQILIIHPCQNKKQIN